MLDYLRIRGMPEYWSVLDSEVAAALGGGKTAKEALDDVAAAWDAITDRLGREQQLKAYQAAMATKVACSARASEPGQPAACRASCSAVVEVTPDDYFELVDRQTSGSTKNVTANELTWFAVEMVE